MVAQDLGVLAGILLVLLAWWMNKKRLCLPPHFWLYIGFATLVGFDVMTRGNPFTSPQFFSMLVSGSLFWTAFYMVGNGSDGIFVKKNLPYMLAMLGYGFLGGFLLNQGGYFEKYRLFFGFIQPITKEHMHLGVFWGILMVIIIPIVLKENRMPWYKVITVVIGVYLMIISQARSSFLGLMVGMLTYYYELLMAKTSQAKVVRVILLTTILVMVGISIYKPIRSFYFITPAVLNILREPLGSGIGQFEKVSAHYAYLYESGDFVTSRTHNLFLEMFIGLGWLGVFYVIWFGLSLVSCVKQKPGGRNLYLALFLAISAVFMVDPAYGIPTMGWIWMSVLGLAQSDEGKVEKADLQT